MAIKISSRGSAALAGLALLAPALGGCMTERSATASTYPADVRERHPIVLATSAKSLDLFVQGSSGLDARERADLAGFVSEYRRIGSGPMTVQVPLGASYGTRAAMGLVRDAVGGRVAISHYAPADPRMASPIRLSFSRLQAKVAGQCGLWPQDLGVGDADYYERNQQYWNFGCATQSNFASQVADPVDLVRGRRESAPDTLRRMHNIEAIRQGQDPSTNYRQDGQNKINQSVGQ